MWYLEMKASHNRQFLHGELFCRLLVTTTVTTFDLCWTSKMFRFCKSKNKTQWNVIIHLALQAITIFFAFTKMKWPTLWIWMLITVYDNIKISIFYFIIPNYNQSIRLNLVKHHCWKWTLFCRMLTNVK